MTHMGAGRINRHPCTEAEESANWGNIQVYVDNYETRIEVIETVVETGGLDNFTVQVDTLDAAPGFLDAKFSNISTDSLDGPLGDPTDREVAFYNDGTTLRGYVNTVGLGGGSGDEITGGTYITVTGTPPDKTVNVDVTKIQNHAGNPEQLLGYNVAGTPDTFEFNTLQDWIVKEYNDGDHSYVLGNVQVIAHTAGVPISAWMNLADAVNAAAPVDPEPGEPGDPGYTGDTYYGYFNVLGNQVRIGKVTLPADAATSPSSPGVGWADLRTVPSLSATGDDARFYWYDEDVRAANGEYILLFVINGKYVGQYLRPGSWFKQFSTYGEQTVFGVDESSSGGGDSPFKFYGLSNQCPDE